MRVRVRVRVRDELSTTGRHRLTIHMVRNEIDYICHYAFMIDFITPENAYIIYVITL